MDYVNLKPRDKDNIDKPDTEVIFEYNPSSPINFAEATIIINIRLFLKNDGLSSEQIQSFITNQKDKIKFNKFFIYSLFKTITYKENNIDIFTNKRIYDYVRMKNIYYNNQADIYGFKNKNISKEIFDEYKFQFAIPIKYLFSEFEDINAYSSSKNTIIIELSSGIKNILNKDENIKITYNISSMSLLVPIKYNILENQIERLNINECKELVYRKTIIGEINCSKDFMESTVQLRGEKNKPISVLFMCKDKDENIVNNELNSIKLIINDNSYPNYEYNIGNDYDIYYYYQMYCRYLEFYYRNPLKSEGNNIFGDFHISSNYYTFEEFKEHQIYCFILPQLPDDTSYEIFADIKFYSKNRKTVKITYLYSYFNQ